MKVEKVAAISEIVSSIAIVVTLLYLAVQTQQTNAALFANSRQATMVADLQLIAHDLEYPEVVMAIANDGRSAEEQKLMAWFSLVLRIREFAWFQYQSGILDQRTFDSYMNVVPIALASDFGQQYWATSHTVFDPTFVEYVDTLIAFERR